MKDIMESKNTNSLVKNIQDSHEPKVGDVYRSKHTTYETFIRIKSVERLTLSNGREITKFFIEKYDMFLRQWVECDEYRAVSMENLVEYYSYVVCDFEEMLGQFDKIESGEISIDNIEPVDSTALVSKGKTNLIAMREQHEMAAARIGYIRDMMIAKANDYKRAMERKMEPLQKAIVAMQTTVSNMNYAIRVIEGYLGTGVETVTISDGERCIAGTPVSVRQRILFMDEEVACIMADGQGLDCYGKSVFYEWMKDSKNRDIITPEERCIVIMKPKRFEHRYSRDAYENKILNEWNHHSFIVVRDGDNVICIESDNLDVYSKVFCKPDTKCETSWDRNSRESLVKRTIYLCAVLQGLVEQGVLFNGDPSVNIIKGENVNLIYDDEDSLLGTGILPFNQFLKEKNKDVRRGSRILHYGGGEPTAYYASEWNIPDRPKTSVYNVEVDDRGKKYILYMPNSKAYSWNEGYTERKRRIGWTLGDFISYDNVTSSEIEAYLNDRTQRKWYADIIPILTALKKEKSEEESWERDFTNLMVLQFRNYDEKIVRKVISEAIVWWREKVIYTRPLKSDDKKSWRMIKSYIEKTIK